MMEQLCVTFCLFVKNLVYLNYYTLTYSFDNILYLQLDRRIFLGVKFVGILPNIIHPIEKKVSRYQRGNQNP